jgi:hypothetical protein
MTKGSDPLQDIAWNGIRFQVPAGWEPVAIFNNYLMFEDQYQPVFELKWQHIQGSFSVERVLKQLRRESGKKDSFRPEAVPVKWQPMLKEYNCYAFSWQGATAGGTGLLRHCPHCNLTILLQLYGKNKNLQEDPACLRLLRTLRCHQDGERSRWAIYDIAFSLPAAAVLQSQDFLTGRYTISFQLADLYFSLLRFKPARVLLAENGLTGFGNKILGNDPQYLPDIQDEQTAGWQKKGTGWLRFKAGLRRKQADHLLLLRYLPENNVILGVRAKSNKTINKECITDILANYTAG